MCEPRLVGSGHICTKDLPPYLGLPSHRLEAAVFIRWVTWSACGQRPVSMIQAILP